MAAIMCVSLSDTSTHMYLYYIHYYGNWDPSDKYLGVLHLDLNFHHLTDDVSGDMTDNSVKWCCNFVQDLKKSCLGLQ